MAEEKPKLEDNFFVSAIIGGGAIILGIYLAVKFIPDGLLHILIGIAEHIKL